MPNAEHTHLLRAARRQQLQAGCTSTSSDSRLRSSRSRAGAAVTAATQCNMTGAERAGLRASLAISSPLSIVHRAYWGPSSGGPSGASH
eukprot:7987365-Lingulodinium_polyedra.AAC.1